MHKPCVLAERRLLWRADYYTLSCDGPIGAGRFVRMAESLWAPSRRERALFPLEISAARI